MPVTAAQSIADSSLFKLPPELRNRIYELALGTKPFVVELDDLSIKVFPGYVTIYKDTGIPEPPLLTACKTVRHEAIGVFYSPHLNNIQVMIDSYHPATAVLWKRKMEALHKQYGLENILHSSWNEGPRNWANLELWLLATHQDLVYHAWDGIYDDLDYIEAKLVHVLFFMVEGRKEHPWSDVQCILQDFRELLEAMNSDWEQ